jgi:hypothetical protein
MIIYYMSLTDQIVQWHNRILSAMSLLSRHENSEALTELNAFHGTAVDHLPLVLELRGRAHFNENEYRLAINALQLIREGNTFSFIIVNRCLSR